MALASGQLYRVTYQFSIAGQTVENVVHMRERTGASTPAELRVSAETFFSLWKSIVCSAVPLTQVIIKQLTPAALDEDIFTPTTHTGGSHSGSPGNNTVACVFTLRTGESGRSKRGRMYIGGLNADQTGRNSLDTTDSAIVDNAALAIVAAFGPAGSDAHLELGVYSKLIGGTTPATMGGYRPVVQILARKLLANQRRRRIGVGM